MSDGGVSPTTHAVPGEPLSALGSTAAVTREALKILAQVVRRGRARRNSLRVSAEYDAGYWADILARKPWQQAASLSEFLVPRDRTTRVAKVDGRLTRISNEDYYRYRAGMLQRVLAEYAGHAPSLAEVGCGYGANLFSLLELHRWRPLLGFDVSQTALEAAREIARHFKCEGELEFHRLDLTNRSAPEFCTTPWRDGVQLLLFRAVEEGDWRRDRQSDRGRRLPRHPYRTDPRALEPVESR